MTSLLSDQAALDTLELLRQYISEHKEEQKEIKALNKILQCAVNQDNVNDLTNRWDNFWTFLDVDRFMIFDMTEQEQILEDAVDFAKIKLHYYFIPGTKVADVLKTLYKKTTSHLSVYSSKCNILFQMEKLIAYVQSNAQRRQQVERILFSLDCYEQEDIKVVGIDLARFLFHALSDPTWWKINMKTELILDDFIDYWDYFEPEKGVEAMWKKATHDIIWSLAEAKDKSKNESCAQKLIEFAEEKQSITPTP